MALKKVDGVEDAEVSYETGSATVTFDPALTTPEAFITELTRLTGFTAEVTREHGATDALGEPIEHDTTIQRR